MMEQFADKWMEVAKQIGGTAWEILVKQVFIHASIRVWLSGVLFVISLVGFGVLYWHTRKVIKVLDENSGKLSYHASDKLAENSDGICIVFSIVTILGGLFAGMLLIDNLGAMIYPEGAALERLISAMGR